MTNITSYMSADHQSCDDAFVEFENRLPKQDWPQLNSLWQVFSNHLNTHLLMEESVLFPAFEQATGSTAGPTSVMRMEHEQMRALMNDMQSALQSKDCSSCQGIAETLMFLIQQHNMKEEHMLYPMADQHTNGPSVLKDMQSLTKEQQCA